MYDLSMKRIPFSEESLSRLQSLRSRIIIKENNILCRIGFCLSLEEPGHPSYPEALDGGPIDRYTLLGAHEKTFIALLVTWMLKNGYEKITSENLTDCFIAHMDRGAQIISSRVKSMTDFAQLVPGELR